MRKVLCILLSVILVLTSGILTYAKGDDKNNKNGKKIEDKIKDNVKGHEKEKEKKEVKKDKDKPKESVTTSVYYDEASLKDLIKKTSKDLNNMKKLLKDLQSLNKKHKKDKTMIFINGEEIDTGDAPPVIKHGRTLVPIRAISNGLKANVSWDPKTRTVIVTKSVYSEVYGVRNMTVELVIGAPTIKVDGANVTAEVPASLINGRTFVPIRLLGEIFKMNFDWDSESNTVIIIENTTTIKVSTATPVPTVTPIPTPTSTPSSTPTTPTSTPTATPTPTATTAATSTPTPVPTSTPEITPTPTAAAATPTTAA